MNRSSLWQIVGIFGISWVISLSVYATAKSDLQELKDYMRCAAEYDAQHDAYIDSIQSKVDTVYSYALYDQLFEAYKSYRFDDAQRYVEHLRAIAEQSGDKELIAHAAVQRSFAYLSAGLFKEGADIMEAVDTVGLSAPVKADYCFTYARLLYDLADYNQAGLSHAYIQQANHLLRTSLMLYTPTDTADYWSTLAMIDQHEGLYERAIERFGVALTDTRINMHQKAIFYSTIAYLYYLQHDNTNWQHYNILAAIEDIKSSTKETTAMRHVAECLYAEGDIENASLCIRKAQEDAIFYNARHRQVEISQILPIIEKQHTEQLHTLNQHIKILAIIAIVLLIVTLCALFLIFKRQRALREAGATIEQMNQNLMVANRVKEEYLGMFLRLQSEFINDVEHYEETVRKLAVERRYADLMKIPKNVDANKKRDEFYKQLDNMLLSVFPTFVEDFNALLRPNERIILKNGERLNTDLRIFALIRLGITHNEVIADVLGYTVNTIYTYKTKIKQRSDLDNKIFDERLMAIPSFSQTITDKQ